MLVRENAYLRLEVSEDASLLRLIEKSSCTVMESHSPCSFIYGGYYDFVLHEHATAKVILTESGVRIEFSEMQYWARFKGNEFIKPINGPDLHWVFRVEMDGKEAVFTVERPENMDNEELTVKFPHAFFSWNPAQEGELLVPNGYGGKVLFPSDAYGAISLEISRFPLFGMTHKSQAGFGVYVRTPYDASAMACIDGQDGTACADVNFTFNRRFADYAREIRVIMPGPGTDATEIAKWYRSIVQREGRFISLKEKIAATPEIGEMVGAVVWKHNVYSQRVIPKGVNKFYSLYMPTPEQAVVEGKPGNWTAYEVFDTAKKLGFDRVAVWNTGWNHYGYDTGFPKRLPPNPERGTPEEFAAAAAYARKLSPGFTYGVHDNYIDIYPESPEFDLEDVCRTFEGTPMRGGIWHGGRCMFCCTCRSVKYAERDLPQIAKLLGRGSLYIDVLPTALRECYHPDHPASKRDDMNNRRRIFELARKYIGAVASEYLPGDGYADVAAVGAYARFLSGIPKQFKKELFPLWQMVYHDSVLNYTGEGTCGIFGTDYLNYTALYGLLPTSLDDRGLRASRELRSAFTSELIEFKTFDNGSAAKSVFSDGTVVAANFSAKSENVDGVAVPPKDFIVK